MKNKLLLLAMGFALTTQTLFAQVPSYVPTNGLVGYWPFNGNANDESGNGNNGVVAGATLTSDRYGNANKAYLFNSNYITIPYNSSFDFTDFTVSVWVSTSQTTCGVAVKQLKFSNASNEKFVMGVNNPLLSTNFSVKYNNPSCAAGIGWQNNTSALPIFNNQFHHLVGTVNGNTTKLFIDGVLVNTLVLPYNQSSTCLGGDIQIGRDWSSFLNYFLGKIDDIGIWNRALSEQEITNLYNSANTNECLTMTINTGPLSTNPVTYTSSVNIYPNPANDHITIDCGNLANVSGWTIKIVNTLGQEVFSGAMNTQQYVVPLNSWTGQGMYFVKIINAQNEVVNIKKIILQ